MLTRKESAIVTGIDRSPVGIEVAKKTAAANDVEDRCNFFVSHFSDSNFPDGQFDII